MTRKFQNEKLIVRAFIVKKLLFFDSLRFYVENLEEIVSKVGFWIAFGIFTLRFES